MTDSTYVKIMGVMLERESLAIEPARAGRTGYVAFADGYNDSGGRHPLLTDDLAKRQMKTAPEQYCWYFMYVHNIDVDPTKYCRHRNFEDDL